MDKKNYISISEVEATQVQRISTYIPEFDWLYGVSKFGSTNAPIYSWGLPVGKISVWQAEKGTGKSRLAIEMARLNVTNGSTVLYFQNEVDLPTFASWVRGSRSLSNFFCSEETVLLKQVKVIEDLSPQLVIVDSINLIEEFGNGRDSEVREVVQAFRDVVAKTSSHIIFLCQLNKDGSAKGSSSLGHMPDILLNLTKEEGGFRVSANDKHRYGRTGSEFFGIWKHTDSGVECISQNRLGDRSWYDKRDSFSDDDIPNLVELPDMADIPDIPDINLSSPAEKKYSPNVLEAFKVLNGPREKTDDELTFWQKVKRDTFKW